jgi:hypothetical protein
MFAARRVVLVANQVTNNLVATPHVTIVCALCARTLSRVFIASLIVYSYWNNIDIDNIPKWNIVKCSMWQIEPTTGWERDQKHYAKKRPNELAAVLRNLQRYLSLLNVCKNPKAAQAGYLHPEPGGVLAIDQRGGGGNLQETRLYTFADDDKKMVYLIAIGDKDSQHSDVEYCKHFVNALRNPADSK